MRNMAISNGSKMLRAMGNEKRLEILYRLSGQEYNVGELEKMIGLSQSALSQHLAVLRTENLVKTRRSAQTIFYSIKSDKVTKVLNLLDALFNKNSGGN